MKSNKKKILTTITASGILFSFAVTAGATALADVMPSATQTQTATYKQANENHLVNNHITENQSVINQAAAKEKLAKKAAEAQAAAEQAAAQQAAAEQAAAQQAAAEQAAAQQAAAEQAAAQQAAAEQAAAEQAAAEQAAAQQAAAEQAAAAQAAAEQAAAAQAAATVPDVSSNYFFYQVVQAEAGPSYQEKLNVASVIMNRVASGAWGGTTIDAVLNAPGQFEAVSIGAAAAQTPSAETIQAVNEVLNGTRTTSAQSFRASGDGVTNVFF
ncbi:streptococcal non-m secreted siba [Trichococcus palustris]|uniref:Streptococcal non-m secreted siba n=1 Tax=Trichococcus palustris TaxID=140314 RepID=A0A143Y4Z9_9LACT|nr:cell wall hydrolase [Trichococcus palustris]CZQ81821.1 streptococcal non-m secreted siba [Trichococcus palustris]SFK61654.1 Cell Wall Hydrolase [Trichococcus palustris]